VLVLVTPQEPGVLRYDGAAMVPARPMPCGARVEAPGSTLRAGQRYADSRGRIEVRCLRGGHGELTFEGDILTPVIRPFGRKAAGA
jgi:hypothetical protein